MVMMYHIRRTNSDVEIGDVWRPQWQLVSYDGWVTADTVYGVFELYERTFGYKERIAKPNILARYETCAVGNIHGVYRPGFVPTIDVEDRLIVRNLQIVAVLDPEKYPDYALRIPNATFSDFFDIEEFIPFNT